MCRRSCRRQTLASMPGPCPVAQRVPGRRWAQRPNPCRVPQLRRQSARAAAKSRFRAQSILKINEQPIFPRCIEYRGEKLAFLKKLGFNTLWLGQVPSPAFLDDARQLGMWLVCPPPELPETDSRFRPAAVDRSGIRAGAGVGHGARTDRREDAGSRSAAVRSGAVGRFPKCSRPLICAPGQ